MMLTIKFSKDAKLEQPETIRNSVRNVLKKMERNSFIVSVVDDWYELSDETVNKHSLQKFKKSYSDLRKVKV